MRYYSLLRQLNIRSIIASLVIVSISLFVSGCAGNDPKINETSGDKTSVEGFVMPKAGTYDSADTEALVVSIDKEKNTCNESNKVLCL